MIHRPTVPTPEPPLAAALTSGEQKEEDGETSRENVFVTAFMLTVMALHLILKCRGGKKNMGK